MPGRALTPQEAASGQYAPNQVVRVGGGLYLRDNNQQPQQREPQTYADYINQAFSNPDYQKALSDANALAEQAPTYLADKQKELYANDPILQQLNTERAKFVGDLYSTPFTARDQYANILDPVKREALVSQAVGNIMGQLQGTQGMITQRQGTQDQLAQRAYDIFKAQLDQKQTAASDLASKLKDIATKGYEAKTAADKRAQSLADSKELARYRAGLNSGSATPPSQQRTNVYRPIGTNKDGSIKYQQVGFSLFNPKTATTTYTDLNGKPLKLNPEDRVSAISSGFNATSQDVTTDNTDLNPFQ